MIIYAGNKRDTEVWNALLECSLKNDRMISIHYQNKPFSITVIQVYAPTTKVKRSKMKKICKIFKT